MAKTPNVVGEIVVAKSGDFYEIQIELPEKLYPYLLHAMQFNNPEAFEQSLRQVKEGKFEKEKILASGESYFIQKSAVE